MDFDDLQDSDNPEVLSNANVVVDDPFLWWSQSYFKWQYMEFDDPKVFDNPHCSKIQG